MSEPFSTRLKKALQSKGMSATELSLKTDVPKSAISQYLSGVFKPKQKRTLILAEALGVDAAWLMGYDVPMENTGSDRRMLAYDNIIPISTVRLPLLGNIACGEPIFADEHLELYVDVGSNIKADFCLRAHGDSMIGARIYDGDIVFVRKQDMVDNGEIAVVLIEDEATLKRVYYDREAGELSLCAENPRYKTMRFFGEQLNQIRILGRAVAFQSDVR